MKPKSLSHFIATTLIALAPAATFAALVPSEGNGGITLPEGFNAVVVADNIDGLRGIAVSENGDIYGSARGRGVVMLRDTDGNGVANLISYIAETPTAGASPGSGMGIHGGYLYYSTDDAVYRYKLAEGGTHLAGKLETVVTGLPNKRQHSAKMFAFGGDGMLYVEVGSPSNALGNPDRALGAKGVSDEEVKEFLSEYGGFWRFDPNKLNQTFADGEHFSTGHRHVLSIAWNPVSEAFFVAQNGRDVLNGVNPDLFTAEYNSERVSEEFHILKEGSNFGWPYTYYDPIDKVRLFSPEYGGDGKKSPAKGTYSEPLIAFPAHWAPMQMAYYGEGHFPAKYHHGMFVAFHGSWNRSPMQRGYNVCFIPFDEKGMPTGEYEVFASGFEGTDEISSPRDAKYRPMGVAVGPDGSLYVGSDQGGRVWRIFHAGE